ncbi:MAG: DNA-binding response regulator [Balneolaceae bacterium]|nr:MAG: DNA-binding response regulator [Balneolaceae bacterium]
MRVLIIDDIRLAREELRRLVQGFPDIMIVGEAADASEARRLIIDKNPDLLLLDIQMPGENGFELLQSLDAAPEVIFTTAYDEYAVKAFEQNALDYLMKPIQKERLGSALEKVRKTMLIPNMHAQKDRLLGPGDKFFVRDGERCWFIRLADVRYFETMGNFSLIHFGNEKVVTPKTLNSIEERLNPATFFRANRQVIINLEFAERIEPWFSGGLRVHFPDNVTFDISRRQAAKLKNLLSL